MTGRSAADRIPTMSVGLEATIADAMQAIDRGQLGVALVVDSATGRFNSLASDGDVRRALLRGAGLSSPVAAITPAVPRTGSTAMSAAEIADLFSDKTRVVPLLDEDGCVADLAVFDNRSRLPVAEPLLGEKELLYVSECVLTGWVSSAGPFVTRFEEMFAEFCDVPYAISTSSGTTALHLALLAAGVGPGDEVIVPSLTFVASPNAVAYTGATPVFADSDPATWNIDPATIEALITPRTKAIMPVHLYGHPADMDPILEIAREHGLSVVEDAAEAHGATYRSRRVGGIGDIGVYSFYGNKIVTTGEGGMVVTRSRETAECVRMLRDHGMDPQRRYWHPVLGYNYRLTNLQAALGVAQMERVDAILKSKREVAARYLAGLGDVDGLIMPPGEPWAESVYWLFTIAIDEGLYGRSRDETMADLEHAGIECRPVFIPAHQQPLYDAGASLPVAERLSRTGLSLPSAAVLAADEQMRVIEAMASPRVTA
jgi:perosamine synthetase